MSDAVDHERDAEQAVRQLKARIIANARKGLFARNPLLTTVHAHTCPHCHHQQRVVYLESLKTGDFEIGATERIEVLDTSGPMGLWETEHVTPLIIPWRCAACGTRVEVRPVSVEYLQHVLTQPPVTRAMFA
jgi:hypothetical protein